MKEFQFDHGRQQYSLQQTCRPLSLNETLDFACAGCGSCCRGRKDILLSGYDLWRICVRLNLPAAVVVRGYCRKTVGTQSLWPVLRVRPVAEERYNCPFLVHGRCSIHEAAPLACALYPLAQQIDTDTGAVCYFLQSADCGDRTVQNRCEEYLQANGVFAREPVDVAWATQCTRLSLRVQQLAPMLPAAQLKFLQQRMFQELYLSPEREQPYLPQFTAAVQRVDAYLDLVQARVRQRGTVQTQQKEVAE